MSAATVQETSTCPAWCDQDCGEGLHWHWIMRENWQVQAVIDTHQEPPLPGVYVGLSNSDADLSPDDARDLADAILAAVATLKA